MPLSRMSRSSPWASAVSRVASGTSWPTDGDEDPEVEPVLVPAAAAVGAASGVVGGDGHDGGPVTSTYSSGVPTT